MRVSAPIGKNQDLSLPQTRAAATTSPAITDSFVKSEPTPLLGRAILSAALGAGAAGVAYAANSMAGHGMSDVPGIASKLIVVGCTTLQGAVVGFMSLGLAAEACEPAGEAAMFHNWSQKGTDMGLAAMAIGTAAGAGGAILGTVFGASPVISAVIAGTLGGVAAIALTSSGSPHEQAA